MLDKSRDTSPPAAGSGRTAVSELHHVLRERILSGEAASGARLPVDALRTEFGVSTSTVREALSRLLADHLVTSENQRGFRVAPLSIDDFKDIATTRKILETSAMHLSLMARDDDWEANLVAAYHRLSMVEDRLFEEDRSDQTIEWEEWEERNAAFHDALVSNCHNKWLVSFRRQLHQLSYRYNRLSLSLTKTPKIRDVRDEHRAIYEAALAGNADELERLLIVHIDLTVAAIIGTLEGTLSEGTP